MTREDEETVLQKNQNKNAFGQLEKLEFKKKKMTVPPEGRVLGPASTSTSGKGSNSRKSSSSAPRLELGS